MEIALRKRLNKNVTKLMKYVDPITKKVLLMLN